MLSMKNNLNHVKSSEWGKRLQINGLNVKQLQLNLKIGKIRGYH
jgi:hypothetical protein